MSKPLSIGLLGAAFDPIHHGHLDLAKAAMQYAQYDQLLLIPTGIPVHRPPFIASATHRINMLKLALADYPDNWLISTIECDHQQPAYFHQTLARLKQQHPSAAWEIILGWDAFEKFDQWENWSSILSQARLLVSSRPGYEQSQANKIQTYLAEKNQGDRITLLDKAPLEISSTEIRQQLQQTSYSRDIPKPVLTYIQQHQLYR